MPRRMHLHRALRKYSMNQENFYDPEKPEEYVHDPELVDYDQLFKDLWEKEDNFLKSVGVEPTS